MPSRGSGRGRHGEGHGRQPVWQPRNHFAGEETSQTRATGREHMVRPGSSAPRTEHDPYRNQPPRGGAGRGFRARGRTVPPPLTPSRRTCPHKPPDWYFTSYIRTDLQGFYHTYPDLGGPFKSLQEADNAIDHHLHDRLDPKMSSDSLDKLSIMERAVRKSLYWPDGTRRSCLEPLDESHDEIHLLVQALVDQYNENHNLLGDLALQLKDVQHDQFFFSKGDEYFHFNFTTGTKGVVDSFFAEVKCTQGEHEEMVVRCFCVVKPNDNGRCYGCQNNGAVDIKHPNKADAYCRGRVDEYMPVLGGYHIEQSFERVEDEERRLRYQYQCLDDPSFVAEHFPNCVKRGVKA